MNVNKSRLKNQLLKNTGEIPHKSSYKPHIAVLSHVLCKTMGVNSHFHVLQGDSGMSNIKHRAKIEAGFVPIWKKTNVDMKGRCVLPQKLRHELGLNAHSNILWISVNRKNGKQNEFLIEVGVKND